MFSSLHGHVRQNPGRGECNRLRSKGIVPGVLYGNNSPNLLVEFSELELFEALHIKGEHGIIDIDIDGNKEKAMIKEVQHTPLTRKITHIDIQRVDDTNRIKTRIPIKITGDSRYINSDDVVQIQTSEIEVEGKAKDIPGYFTVNISSVPPGGKFTAADLEVSDEITVLDNPNTVIALVTTIKNKPTEPSSNEVSSYI